MFMKHLYKNLFFITLVVITLQMASCISPKKVIYLSNLQDTTSGNSQIARNVFENPIQKNDQLWITIGGSNPEDLYTLNSANGSSGAMAGANGSNSILGYLVEADGKIQIPYVGKVKAEGLTRIQLQSQLAELFKPYTKNPIVNVRFLNYSFSVMGEVVRAGKFNMPTERVTILEALSMAGDLTDLGKRENVLVIREENGQRNSARVNLLSKDLFNSPYFYLKTNDVVYVEPVKAKFISRSGVPQYLSIIAVGLSLILTIINLRK
jgi:polysaccharide biosynthesis/export protein